MTISNGASLCTYYGTDGNTLFSLFHTPSILSISHPLHSHSDPPRSGERRSRDHRYIICAAHEPKYVLYHSHAMPCQAMPCQMPINMRSAPHQSIPRYYYHNQPSHRGLPRFIFDTPTPTTHPQQRRCILYSLCLPSPPVCWCWCCITSPHDVVTLAPLSTLPLSTFPHTLSSSHPGRSTPADPRLVPLHPLGILPFLDPFFPRAVCRAACGHKTRASKPRPSPLPAPVLGAR